jgi:hypothetical protein
MTNSPLPQILHHLQRLVIRRDAAALEDSQLLERFIRERESPSDRHSVAAGRNVFAIDPAPTSIAKIDRSNR